MGRGSCGMGTACMGQSVEKWVGSPSHVEVLEGCRVMVWCLLFSAGARMVLHRVGLSHTGARVLVQ
eukprot:9001931-Lingulodinium_polyedra.AAC.1